MSVPLQPARRGGAIRLADALPIACALAIGLIPLAVFVVLSRDQTIDRAEASLAEIVEVARHRVEEIVAQAELELTRFVRVTAGRVTLEAERLLDEIVYTNPYFREGGIIDAQGFLIYSTAALVEPPIEIPAELRSDPSVEALQILGLVQTRVMREESIVLALPTEGEGEVNLLLDPAILSLFFEDVELGPRGALAFVGPKGGALSVRGQFSGEKPSSELIRVARTTGDGRVRVIGEVARSWALRDWSANLLYSVPVAGVCSLLLAVIMTTLIRRRAGLDHDLRLGIRREELRLKYQPIIDLPSGRCVVAEALLRWRHPVHGEVRPDVFIPVAEETGLIGPLTEWVVRRVLRDQAPLLDRFPDLRLSINCTSSLLSSTVLEDILRRVAVPPQVTPKLVFEVTENVFVGRGANSARETMARLRRVGFRFALDDFGSGYAGFSYLQRLDFDFLKIDRSFVQAIGSSSAATSIFDTLVELGHKLGLVTVAEGVETEEQRLHLDRCGVPLAQGWLFAAPLPIGDFTRFLSEPRPWARPRFDRHAHVGDGRSAS